MGLAERCLDPAEASRLVALTAIPDETEGASPGAAGYWSEAFQRLVSTLRLRAAMETELAGHPSPRAPDEGYRTRATGPGLPSEGYWVRNAE